jgi:hypothetical protein
LRECKYLSLGNHLKMQTVSSVTLTYAEIEGVLGFRLVPIAYKRAQWWENDEKTKGRQCRSWMDVGWRTEKVELGKSIAFTRSK